MSTQTSTETKVDGQTDQVRGQIKETIGSATGDDALKRQGEREQDQGAVKKAWGNIKSIFSK